MPVHTAVARNFAEASENKIHSDDIAKRFGFTGALVPGVTVFGHLAWPVTRRFGERWLQGSWVTTRFIKPAYDSETISLTDRETGARWPRGRMSRTQRACCLRHWSARSRRLSPTWIRTQSLRFRRKPDTRVEITWDTVHVGEPFAAYVVEAG